MLFNAPPVKTFMLRQGRFGATLRSSLEQLKARGWPQLYEAKLANWFQESQHTPIHFEIGFGMSTSLIENCQTFPGDRFIGSEVHAPGVARTLQSANHLGLDNLILMNEDGLQFLREFCPPKTLSSITLLFPDPWPKKRHWKRRILNESNVHLFLSRLQENGRLFFRTDHQEYFEKTQSLLQDFKSLKIDLNPPNLFANYPKTHYHQKAEQRAQKIQTILLKKEA